MARGIHRQGDSTAGHGCWPPTSPAAFSDNVLVNGRGAVRQGDAIIPHTCPSIPETHSGAYAGDASVLVNGRPVQVVGNPVTCGDRAAGGSNDVVVGG
ncbi:MAG: PAAR domain-containing protein [Planctomycetaceae bacterium]|nr:PAAR domain-containing protein [Planctomycetaceae bacterium]